MVVTSRECAWLDLSEMLWRSLAKCKSGCLVIATVCNHVLLTWLKFPRALLRLACIPVGGSLVILMEDSKMPWGMMWPDRSAAGSADM